MRRSHINTLLADAEDFMDAAGIALPPFARWSPEDFERNIRERGYSQVVERGLGWAMTDFALGDFKREGIVVFTARMGDHRDLETGRGRLYAEKLIIQRDGQRTPAHFHRVKTEDVVNRFGGRFCLRLHMATPEGLLDETASVLVEVDGQSRSLAPGSTLSLRPGESVTLAPGVFHEFWAEGGDALAAEISLANDDASDNYFLPGIAPDVAIEEDEPPRRLLVSDYAGRFADVA